MGIIFRRIKIRKKEAQTTNIKLNKSENLCVLRRLLIQNKQMKNIKQNLKTLQEHPRLFAIVCPCSMSVVNIMAYTFSINIEILYLYCAVFWHYSIVCCAYNIVGEKHNILCVARKTKYTTNWREFSALYRKEINIPILLIVVQFKIRICFPSVDAGEAWENWVNKMKKKKPD